MAMEGEELISDQEKVTFDARRCAGALVYVQFCCTFSAACGVLGVVQKLPCQTA